MSSFTPHKGMNRKQRRTMGAFLRSKKGRAYMRAVQNHDHSHDKETSADFRAPEKFPFDATTRNLENQED